MGHVFASTLISFHLQNFSFTTTCSFCVRLVGDIWAHWYVALAELSLQYRDLMTKSTVHGALALSQNIVEVEPSSLLTHLVYFSYYLQLTLQRHPILKNQPRSERVGRSSHGHLIDVIMLATQLWEYCGLVARL